MTTRSLLFLVLLSETLAVSAAIVIGAHGGDSAIHFKEGRFITWLSGLQLLAISWLSYKTLKTRDVMRGRSLWRSSYAVWGIIALGFLFLAADDLFQIHESIDKGIHHVFSLQETDLTDRIDDLLIALYGLASISVLIAYRDAMKRYREIHPFMICGFVLLFIMVSLDVLTNRDDILSTLVDRDQVAVLHRWLSVAEDSFKVFAEAFFLVGCYTALQIPKCMETEPVIRTDG